jgi:hypothetical protein
MALASRGLRRRRRRAAAAAGLLRLPIIVLYGMASSCTSVKKMGVSA